MALFQSKKVKQLEQQVKALQSFNNSQLTDRFNAYLRSQTSLNYYPDFTLAETTEKYASSDQLYAIINKIAETSAMIPVLPYIKTEDKALNKLKALTSRQHYSTKGIFDIRVQEMKALEDVDEEDEFNKLLEHPNDYQTKTEFLNACYSYYLLNGEVFIFKLRLDGGANQGKVVQLHILPPANVTLHITSNYPLQITGYGFFLDGRTIYENIPVEDIIHWKRFNPYYSINGAHLRGLSPLRAGAMPLGRLSEADNRSMNQLRNGTVPGIVYDKTFQGNEDEVTTFDNQKKAFYDFVKNPANQGAPFFVGSEKGYLPIGLTSADLKIFELQNIDFKRLCNIYKISTILFNSDVAATESNVEEQVKQMYTSACLPMVYAFSNKLNNDLAPDFPAKPYYTNPDISTITELQDDIKDMVSAIAAMPVTITGNEQRELLGYDAIEEEWMDKPMIKSGYAFFDDINIEPVDPTLLNTDV